MKKQFHDTYSPVDDDEDEFEYDGPSRSQRKRDSEALQKLGVELTELPADQLAKIPLPEDVSIAVMDCRKMKSFGAIRRQRQLIGKLMRQLDYASVREAIDRATGASRAAVAALHRTERLRDAMIADDKAITEYVNTHPDSDVQQLRQLVRAARKQRDEGKPPKSSRELYKLLFELELPELDLYAREEEESEAEE